MITKSYMIIDGQWGSTGKGLIAGYLALKRKPDAVVCNFGANAGHTVVTPDGQKVMTQQLPSAIISPSIRRIFIGPGAIINPDILWKEIGTFSKFLQGKKIKIHPRAAVILPRDIESESESLKFISSTRKGVGAALASKVMRKPDAVVETLVNHPIHQFVAHDYDEQLAWATLLQIESAQGFELGLNTGYAYPYCTSRDITPAQVLSDCAIPWSHQPDEIIVSLRTYPIRVGDQWEPDGTKVGTSGPCYPDQVELAWDELEHAPEPERTTVTGKVRRIFTFSMSSYRRMLTFINPSAVFLNFVNYLEEQPDFYSEKTRHMIQMLDREGDHAMVQYIGTGPCVTDVKERPSNYVY